MRKRHLPTIQTIAIFLNSSIPANNSNSNSKSDFTKGGGSADHRQLKRSDPKDKNQRLRFGEFVHLVFDPRIFFEFRFLPRDSLLGFGQIQCQRKGQYIV